MSSSVRSIKVQDAFQHERVELAAAFRWAARVDLHEAVANHFSLAVNEDGTKFLINPNRVLWWPCLRGRGRALRPTAR